MRACFSLLLLTATLTAPAQVVNGSFEDTDFGLFTGWEYTCECGMPNSSLDTPGGTGMVSLDLTAEEQQCTCAVTFDLFQDLPWFTPGVWTLSYWIKGHNGWGPPAGVAVAYRAGFGYPVISSVNPGVTDTTWTYHEDVFAWDGVWPVLDSLLLMVAAGAATDGEQHAFFDDIQLTSIPTGTGNTINGAHPRCYPVPAIDRLWVDIDEEPLDVIAYDSMGRPFRQLAYAHRGASLEIQLSALAAGQGTLRIRTAAAVHVLRFVKD